METKNFAIMEIEESLSTTRRCSNLLFRFVLSTPGLILLVVIYSMIGAILFPLFELHNRELHSMRTIIRSRGECLKELWTITERLNVLYERKWTELAQMQLQRFEDSIVEAAKNDFVETVQRWSFSEALLYSVTVITTIGSHSSLTPKTAEGKILTMFYAIVGIPLWLMCITNLGGWLNQTLQWTYIRLCGKQREQIIIGNNSVHQSDECGEVISHETDCTLCRYDDVCKRDDAYQLIPQTPIKSILTNSPHKNQSKSNYPAYTVYACNSTMDPQSSSARQYKDGWFPLQPMRRFIYSSADESVEQHLLLYQNQQQQPEQEQSQGLGQGQQHYVTQLHTTGLPPEQETKFNDGEHEFMPSTSRLPELHYDDDYDGECKYGCAYGTPSRLPLLHGSHSFGVQQQTKLNDYVPLQQNERIVIAGCGGNSSGRAMNNIDDTNMTTTNDDTIDSDVDTDVIDPNPMQSNAIHVLIAIILIVYLCIGAVLFSTWEREWSICDGIYFCFVTIFTIGSGDLLPKRSFDGPFVQILACCAFLSVGLVLMVALIERFLWAKQQLFAYRQ